VRRASDILAAHHGHHIEEFGHAGSLTEVTH
jgi:hypothetical protein